MESKGQVEPRGRWDPGNGLDPGYRWDPEGRWNPGNRWNPGTGLDPGTRWLQASCGHRSGGGPGPLSGGSTSSCGRVWAGIAAPISWNRASPPRLTPKNRHNYPQRQGRQDRGSRLIECLQPARRGKQPPRQAKPSSSAGKTRGGGGKHPHPPAPGLAPSSHPSPGRPCPQVDRTSGPCQSRRRSFSSWLTCKCSRRSCRSRSCQPG